MKNLGCNFKYDDDVVSAVSAGRGLIVEAGIFGGP